MHVGDGTVLEKVCRPSTDARHITLIDPAKQTPEVAAQRAMVAIECGSSMVFVGGSTDTPDTVVHATCKAIQEAFELRMFAASQDPSSDESTWDIPVVLFPGGAHALSPAADAITFMMLMNSTERAFLVGEQLRGAPHLHRFGVEALPTGYVVCAPGGRVGEVGAAELIQPDDTDLVQAYAQCAQMFGFSLLYLEAGSGAAEPVHPDLIRHAAEVDGLTLLVGGGLRTASDVQQAVAAGANWIVTGTVTEDAASLDELRERLTALVGACKAN
ncbi:MAG: phosphoglycerol geranylgeranyltransferase [Candidatus Poseidonia sp.]|jgi:phosphoglycerol geranylgeranyltransferase|nr:phosphoglycerol geranylgeranyltransferase [Poseidonia sp.]